jgi:glycosyltransferase involved in cell wall biosynthesis
MKKILIINTGEDATLLFEIFSALRPEQFSFALLANQKNLASGKKYNWQEKKINNFFSLDATFLASIFLIISPLIYFYSFCYLAWQQWQKKYSTLLCCGLMEKIIFTPWARALKIKTIWFVAPGSRYLPKNQLLKKLLLFLSRKVKIITSTEFTKQKLILSGFKKETIATIPLGVNAELYRHQENIFSKIAAADNHWPQRKFFTIGTALDLDRKQNIEVLFSAIKKILDIVRFPQIIVIGDGQERKNLTWLAKRIGIENYVWFVGEQQHLKKWLDTLDVFFVTADNLKLKDLNIIIRTLVAKLPLVGPNNIGLEEMIINNRNGALIEPNDSEGLAQILIKLQQRKDWRLLLGEQSKKIADERFSLDTTINALKNIL